MIFLFHPQYLIAHTERLENFKPMPDGLIRVMDVKLK
jgi:peptide/nickel transport system substrate-binding protein